MNIIKKAVEIFKEGMGDIPEQKSIQTLSQALNIGEMYVIELLKGGSEISAFQAVEFYQIASPVFVGVELLANKMARIQPHIWNKKTEQYEDDKDKGVLKLLNNPNADITQIEYFKSISSYFLITGNQYTVATGNINQPPKELFIPSPENINITVSMKDVFPESYKLYKGGSGVNIFKRDETVKLGLIYINGNDKQIWHTRTFNPSSNIQQRVYGMSRLNAVYYEIKQYIESNIHNLATLKNGARLSGLINSENSLSQPQRDFLRQQLNDNYSSTVNAGRMMLLDGGKMTFSELSKSNKDMDFRELKNDAKAQVYIALDIPIPYFESRNMTMNNYSESRLSLYEDAILPLTDRIYQEHTNFLFPRFGMDKDIFMLHYNPEEIPALEAKQVANNEMRKKNTKLTVNEIRELDGFDPIKGPLGDTIYQPINLVPLGTSLANQMPTTKQKFYQVLSGYKDNKGNRVYSDREIEMLIKKYKLEEG